MLPEEEARVKIDKQLRNAGWDIVARNEYVPNATAAVKEALMRGNTESDYLFFIDNKAIAVLEAKREDNSLGEEVEVQAEGYAKSQQPWYGLWFEKLIPLVYMANGKKIYYKNMLSADSKFEEIPQMHSPKRMLKMIGKTSEYGALPLLEPEGLRDCQYEAEIKLEQSFKAGGKKALAVLATGSGKTYLACLASYRMLNYTPVKRILFLADRNNLAEQAETEFNKFDKTENHQEMKDLYLIKRLKKEDDIKATIVISTIQKLFAVLTGQALQERNEDEEDEIIKIEEEQDESIVELGDNLKLPADYFQLIIVDECHRSIYGKWKKVLDYFADAKVIGLTATPTPEAEAYFNKNRIARYTYDESVVDGVNVSARIYRIITDVTAHGGTIEKGSKVTEIIKKTGELTSYVAEDSFEYGATALDKSVVNKNQIREVLKAYKKAIYEELYPEREKKWEYVPKTLIFAKNDSHATDIVDMANEVFGEEFENGETPSGFVQKITYKAEDSKELIRRFREEKDFRIAVTVTLVATGTDVKPIEVVLFMNDVRSDVLYTQMKGRGCRTIRDEKLKEVTPNADTKGCYYIVDAVGVTESEKHIPKSGTMGGGQKVLSLEHLLEHLAHNEVSDENLLLLRDYCAAINRRYEESILFGKHLDYFIANYGYAPRTLANSINDAFAQGELAEYISPSYDNTERNELIYCLIGSLQARNKLLEMQKGYCVETDGEDKTLYAGFSKETARSYIENFEKYLETHKDSIEALRILYNSEDVVITHAMLVDLKERLLAENRQYNIYQIWKNYHLLDEQGDVEVLDTKARVNILTNLIQIVRFAYRKNSKLVTLRDGYERMFSLYCGQAQRTLSEEQKDIMKQIADYIINEGAISVTELNQADTDLWRKSVQGFGSSELAVEMQNLSKFILRVA